MAKNTNLTTTITLTVNANNADKEIKNIKKSVKELDKQINDLQKQGKGDSPYSKWLRKLRSSLNSFQRESVTGAERVKKAVENLAGTSTNELRRARRAAQQFRDSLAANDKRLAEANRNLKAIQGQIDKNTGAVTKHGSAWKTTVKNMMAYASVYGALNMVKSKIQEVISESLKLSDQMANIRKVSNLPMEDIKSLQQRLFKQDTRTSQSEMLDIAYAGAKLGFGNGGVDQLEGFTKAANVVNVALKEDMGSESLTALSKIVENMGLLKKMDIETAMNKIGSSMFRLASTSTATSTNIVEFAKRLTAMARVAGITSDQLLALGSAADSMYLAPEVAATAFTKLFSSLQTNHNLIEKTLKIPDGTINQYFKQGQAMDAILLVFQKMHDLGNMNALKPIFKDLGSDGARLMNVMTAMAKNVDMLKEHLDTSKKAYEDGTAVIDEYNIQQNTAAALMERAQNLWSKAFVNSESVDVVHDLASAWYDFSKSLTSSQVVLTSIQWILTGLVGILKIAIFLLPSLVLGITSAGVIGAVSRLGTVVFNLSKFVGMAITAFKGLSLAMKTNWIVFFASAIAMLVGKLLECATTTKQATGFMAGFKREITGVSDTIAQSAAELQGFKSAIESAAQGTERRKIAIEQFNKKFGTYLSHLLTEKSTAHELAVAYQEVNDALLQKAYLELKEKDMKQQVVPRAAHERNLGMSYDYLIRGTSAAGFNSRYLAAYYNENRGKMSVDKMTQNLASIMFNVPMKQWAIDAAITASHNNGVDDDIEKTNIKKNIKNSKGKTVVNPQAIVFYANRYLRSQMSLVNSTNAVENKFKDVLKPEQPDKETPGSLDNKAIDKAAKAAARKAKAEAAAKERKRKKLLQDQLDAAEGQVKSFTKAIDAYYTLQEQAIQEMYMNGKITEAEMNRLIALMKMKHDTVAAQGRFAIVGDVNNFDDVRKQMGSGFDQFDFTPNPTDKDGKPIMKPVLDNKGKQVVGKDGKPVMEQELSETNKLLKIITTADPKKVGDLIKNLEGQLGVSKENSQMNDIRNNAVNAQKSESDERMKAMQAADNYMLQHKYVEKVAQQFDDALSKSGIVDIDLVQASIEAQKQAAKSAQKEGGDEHISNIAETFVMPKNPLVGLRQDFKREGASHYNVDYEDADSLREWFSKLASKDGGGVISTDENGKKTINQSNAKEWTRYINGFDSMLTSDGEESVGKLKLLFSSLMQWEDELYNANKQAQDYEKKLLDSRWERSDGGRRADDAERNLNVQKSMEGIYGRGTKHGGFTSWQEMFRNQGFKDSMTEDPEIKQAELAMNTAKLRVEQAKQAAASMETIREKERAAEDAEIAYAEKVNSAIKARMDLLQQWVDPLQQFSESVGDAFIKMTESAKDGQQALKDATQDMIKTFAKMTINMMAEQLRMEIQRSLFHKRMQKSESDYMEGMKGENDKGHKSIFKALGSFFKKKKKNKEQSNKEEKNIEKKGSKEQKDIVEDSQKAQLDVTDDAQKGITNILQKTGEDASEAKTQQATADASTTAAETQGNIFAGIASGAAKIIGKLGWWGIPLVAAIQGLLMGLLNSALGKLFGGKKTSDANTNTKLVSGMLTYDSGNVQEFKGAIDKKTYPVVGNDGNVYAAEPTDQLVTGLLTKPITTMVNGQPSLIAERGPEMIIGRETTQALMMSRPDIIAQIVEFDRNRSGMTYRAYDSGNVAQVVGDASIGANSASNADVQQLVATLQAIAPAMAAFTKQIQQPLNAQINGYGSGSLSDFNVKSQKFLKKYGKA